MAEILRTILKYFGIILFAIDFAEIPEKLLQNFEISWKRFEKFGYKFDLIFKKLKKSSREISK